MVWALRLVCAKDATRRRAAIRNGKRAALADAIDKAQVVVKRTEVVPFGPVNSSIRQFQRVEK